MKKLSKAKHRRRVKVLSILVLIIVVFTFTVSENINIHSGLSDDDGADMQKVNFRNYNVPKPEINVRLLTKNKNSRPGVALKKVNGIVIHYTANPGTDAMANRNYFESRKNMADISQNKVSSHFIIGINGEIVQCIPLNEISYASNDRNSDTISIECCHQNESGEFSESTYKAIKELAGWLCAKYNISKKNIIRHYDVTGKLCPIYYVRHEDKWIELKNDIWNYIKEFKR